MDDSELDIREIVPLVDGTAETDRLIAPMRLGRTVEHVEAPREPSDGDIVVLASRLLGLNLSILGEKCCMLRTRWRGGAKSWGNMPYWGWIRAGCKGFMELYPYTSQGVLAAMMDGPGWFRPRRQNTRSSPRNKEEVKYTQGCGQMSS